WWFAGGAAEVAAVLVLLVIGFCGFGALREEIDRIHRLVAEILICGPVYAVGSGLRRDADRGARRSAVLRRVRAGDDLELLDRIHGWTRDLRRQLLDVFRDAVVVHAVEQEVVLQRPGAVDVDAAGAAERRAAALLRVAGALHTGHQREQVVPVADGERQVRHLHLRNDRAERRVVGVQQLRAFRDR